jgi:hypothetical protein
MAGVDIEGKARVTGPLARVGPLIPAIEIADNLTEYVKNPSDKSDTGFRKIPRSSRGYFPETGIRSIQSGNLGLTQLNQKFIYGFPRDLPGRDTAESPGENTHLGRNNEKTHEPHKKIDPDPGLHMHVFLFDIEQQHHGRHPESHAFLIDFTALFLPFKPVSVFTRPFFDNTPDISVISEITNRSLFHGFLHSLFTNRKLNPLLQAGGSVVQKQFTTALGALQVIRKSFLSISPSIFPRPGNPDPACAIELTASAA